MIKFRFSLLIRITTLFLFFRPWQQSGQLLGQHVAMQSSMRSNCRLTETESSDPFAPPQKFHHTVRLTLNERTTELINGLRNKLRINS